VSFTIKRIGYDAGAFSAEIRRGDTTDVDITVTSSVHELPGMESRAASPRDAVLARFNDHRVSSPGGHFLTRADIEKTNPARVSDLLRGVPGVSLPTNPAGRRAVRMTRSNLGAFGDCPPVFWLDGSRAADLNIDDVAVRDVEAMEIYAGPATLPADYKTGQSGTACGVIAIWTRVP
jgi:hypothetical protein